MLSRDQPEAITKQGREPTPRERKGKSVRVLIDHALLDKSLRGSGADPRSLQPSTLRTRGSPQLAVREKPAVVRRATRDDLERSPGGFPQLLHRSTSGGLDPSETKLITKMQQVQTPLPAGNEHRLLHVQAVSRESCPHRRIPDRLPRAAAQRLLPPLPNPPTRTLKHPSRIEPRATGTDPKRSLSLALPFLAADTPPALDP